MIRFLILISLTSTLFAADTNKVVKAELERKTEHQGNKIIVKSREKGSKKESDWKTDREITLMFHNNKKAKRVK